MNEEIERSDYVEYIYCTECGFEHDQTEMAKVNPIDFSGICKDCKPKE